MRAGRAWAALSVAAWAGLALAQAPVPATTCQGAQACERECERGVATACTRAGGLSGGDVLRALGLYQRGCDGGDGAGCAGLADLYETGKGIKADPGRALSLRSVACDRRDGRSCVTLARALEASASSLKDLTKASELMSRAVQLYFKGCDSGVGTACGELSRLYVWGVGMKPDPLGGAVMAQRACDKGDTASCRFLGYLFETGQGVQQDGKKASDAYRKGRDVSDRDAPLKVPTLLTPQAPTLVITSESAGATVFVDKLWAGPAPVGVTVPAGEHLVELTLKDRPDLAVRVTAVAGAPQQVRLGWPGVLKVEVTPAAATIAVDQKPAGRAPLRIELPAGQHVVTVAAPGFESESRPVLVTAGAHTTEAFTLKAAPGAASIATTPSGASVSLDGAVVGVSPWTGDVAPGRHQLELTLAGYKTLKKSLTVKAGVPTSEAVTLEQETASVTIATVPAGAKLSVDAAPVGQTPWTGKLPSGSHGLEASLDGYEPAAESLEVVGTKKVTKVLTLKALPPGLAVLSTPPGAQVSLDGKAVGTTPWSGATTAGKHQLEVTLAGYKPVKKSVTLAPGRAGSEALTLDPEVIAFTITSTPKKAGVRVDGATVGETPFSGKAVTGTHTLEVHLDGYEPVVESFELPSGSKKVTKSFTLKETEPGISVLTTPPGADVYVDDARVGLTPWKGAAKPGAHTVTARLLGYTPETRSVEVKPRAKAELTLTLAVAPVDVTIETTPPGGLVVVNGRNEGVSPVKVSLLPGDHRVAVSRAGSEPRELLETLKPGLSTTWRIELRDAVTRLPDAPPPPPPLVPSDPKADQQKLRAVLADEKADKAAKQRALEALAKEQRDLTDFLADVKPASVRGELCLSWKDRVYPASVLVTAVDGFKDEVPAAVLVNGQEVGPAPFDGVVPSCVTRVSVRAGGGVTLDKDLARLDVREKNLLPFVVPGQVLRVAVSGFGDFAVAPYGFGRGPETHFGGGVRLDTWSKVFHFSVAAKAITLFRDVINAPVAPAADVFVGWGPSFGNETFRVRTAFDVGAWTLVCPTARLTVAITIKELFFITLGGSLHAHPRLFVPVASRGVYAFIRDTNYLFGSTTAALGFGW